MVRNKRKPSTDIRSEADKRTRAFSHRAAAPKAQRSSTTATASASMPDTRLARKRATQKEKEALQYDTAYSGDSGDNADDVVDDVISTGNDSDYEDIDESSASPKYVLRSQEFKKLTLQ